MFMKIMCLFSLKRKLYLAGFVFEQHSVQININSVEKRDTSLNKM